ncbi:MAG: hypothetical protein ACI82F_002038 [Planctomycetota bacterium]|jgi:hypothetical protein
MRLLTTSVPLRLPWLVLLLASLLSAWAPLYANASLAIPVLDGKEPLQDGELPKDGSGAGAEKQEKGSSGEGFPSQETPVKETPPGKPDDQEKPPGDAVEGSATDGEDNPAAAGEPKLSPLESGAEALVTIIPTVPAPARYHANQDMEELLARWTANGLAERLVLGESAGGRPLLGVVLATPGPIPARERTTVLIVGGLDGRSCNGTEAAVRVIEDILGAMERLSPQIAVVVVPWANPDGLTATFEGRISARNGAPLDEDLDGFVDEDGPDDIDGDGVILSMLVADPEGPLARAEDARFLRPATAQDQERWRLVPEGRDDDNDGSYNEDGPGGQRLDASFPVGWSPGLDTGSAPLSSPEARALVDLVRSRRVAVALFLQGNHGGIAIPGGTPAVRGMLGETVAADKQAWHELGHLLGQSEDTEVIDLLDITGSMRGGHPVDWLYSSHGVLAAEWALWGPNYGQAQPSQTALREGSYRRRGDDPTGLEVSDPLAGVATEERRWAHWLDDTRGGMGFVDWLPVELGDGQRALVGGWEPRTRVNPPEELLPGVVGRVGSSVLDLLEGLPQLDVEMSTISRSGGVVEVTLRVRNNGGLPSGVGPLSGDGSGGLRLELELPEGAELLAGETLVQLGHLPAGAASASFTWLLRAKEHSLLQIALDSAWGGRVLREVRL